jgi:hypothetical protein
LMNIRNAVDGGRSGPPVRGRKNNYYMGLRYGCVVLRRAACLGRKRTHLRAYLPVAKHRALKELVTGRQLGVVSFGRTCESLYHE